MKAENELTGIFASINDPATMKRFFREIFTDNERFDLARRWELMKLLYQKKTHRTIVDDLGVSLCKITRGAKILKDKKSVTNAILDGNLKIKSR